MKTISTIAILFLMSFASNAQNFSQEKTQQITKNYIKNLESSADQVVLSSMVQIVRLKANFPEFPVVDIQAELRNVMQHENSEVAYQAFLVSRILDNEQLVQNYKEMNVENAHTYFAELSLSLNQSVFASKN